MAMRGISEGAELLLHLQEHSGLARNTADTAAHQQLEPSESNFTAGAGNFFRQPSCANNSTRSIDNLENLVRLAIVACEVGGLIRQRQVVRKLRTSSFRKVNRSKFVCSEERRPAKSKPWSEVASYCAEPVVCDSTTVNSLRTPSPGNANVRRSNKVGPQSVAGKIAIARRPSLCISRAKGKGLCRQRSISRVKKVAGKETRIQRYCKAILELVGETEVAENSIRKTLGNNPDTSKALRLLWKQQKLRRVGDGGRGKAYQYAATPAGLQELEELKTKTQDYETKAVQVLHGDCQKDSQGRTRYTCHPEPMQWVHGQNWHVLRSDSQIVVEKHKNDTPNLTQDHPAIEILQANGLSYFKKPNSHVHDQHKSVLQVVQAENQSLLHDPGDYNQSHIQWVTNGRGWSDCRAASHQLRTYGQENIAPEVLRPSTQAKYKKPRTHTRKHKNYESYSHAYAIQTNTAHSSIFS